MGDDDLGIYSTIQDYLRAKRREIIDKEKSDEVRLYSIFRCPKCDSNNVKERSVQIRSADEGMDTICICKDCMHNWRIRN